MVATTTADPLAPVFWHSYQEAGGPAPTAVFFLQPRRPSDGNRWLSGVLLFGVRDAARLWIRGRRIRRMVRRDAASIFAGVQRVHHCRSLNNGEGLASLSGEQPDVLVSVGAPEIFKSAVLAIPRIGAVNVHNGLLPAYRGLFATFWEALMGEPHGYTSIHVMSRGIDEGPMLASAAVPMGHRPLFDVLLDKKRAGGKQLAAVLRSVEQSGCISTDDTRSAGTVPGYYSWPPLRAMLLYRLRHLRRWVFQAGQDHVGEP